jgi:hypothetical protein
MEVLMTILALIVITVELLQLREKGTEYFSDIRNMVLDLPPPCIIIFLQISEYFNVMSMGDMKTSKFA